MNISTFYNNKGGCSKTSTVFFVGKCLATAGFSVLCIDADPQGTLAHDTYDLPRNLKGLSELIESPSKLKESIHKSRIENLYIIPPGNDLAEVLTKWESRGLLKEKVLALLNLIRKELEEAFDAVLIDNPPNLVGFPMYASEFSDRIIMPVQSETYCLKATVRTYVKIKMHFPEWEKKNIAIIVTRHNSKRNLAMGNVDAFKEWGYRERTEFEMMHPGQILNFNILNSIIPDSADVGNVVAEKANVYLQKSKSDLAKAYIAATMELFPKLSNLDKIIEEKVEARKKENQENFKAVVRKRNQEIEVETK